MVGTVPLPKFDESIYGATGLRQYGGFLSEELLTDLAGTRGRKVFREMADNDPIIGAVLFAFTALFRSVEWHVEAAEEETDGDEEDGDIPDPTADRGKPVAPPKPASGAKPGSPVAKRFPMAAPPAGKAASGQEADPGTQAPGAPALGPDGQPVPPPQHNTGVSYAPPRPPTPAELGAKFLEEVLDDMELPFDAAMGEIASMFTFGFAPLEILYKRRVGPDEQNPTRRSRFDDGKIGLRGLPLRAQETVYQWLIDEATGTILGMVQSPPNGPTCTIPAEKLLLFRTTETKNNPEGRSILRNAYRPWYFKKRMEEIEAVGIERDLVGFPVARIPANYMGRDADSDERAIYRSYKAMVTSIKRDQNEGVVLPSTRDASGHYLFDFELMTSGGSRSIPPSPTIERYAKEIATTVLADFIFLGQGKTGSFALSSDKTDLFKTALQSFLKSVAGVLNRHLIPALWFLNDEPPETMPKLRPGDIDKGSLANVASLLTSMAGAGAALFPDKELENVLRAQAGLPPVPEEGSDVRHDPNAAGATPPGLDPAAEGDEATGKNDAQDPQNPDPSMGFDWGT